MAIKYDKQYYVFAALSTAQLLFILILNNQLLFDEFTKRSAERLAGFEPGSSDSQRNALFH